METTSNLESEIGLKVDDTEMDAETSLGDDDKGVELEEASMKGDSVATAELNSPLVTPNRSEGINLEPFVGMILESEVEAYQLYNEYSKQMGFGIRKKQCRRSRANNDIIAGWYVCSRQGADARRGKTANPRLVTRIGCPAELKVKRMAVKKWQVIDFVKEHNHELDPENARLFRSHRRIQAPEQNLIEIVSRNLGVREQVNVVEKEQQRFLSAVDSHALHMHFMRMHSRNPAFSYAMDFNKKEHVRNAFWVDASSKVAYTHFGDVVMLDTMFLTNRFKMPLVSFVGVNHHGQSILLGCALLGDETPASYVWLFKAWLEAMSGQPPKALITDRSNSIATAVAEVFPETCHRFCLWLICKRVSEKLGYVWRAQTNFMKKFYKCIFDSLTEDEFEKRWWKFIQHFGLMEDEWLQGLYDDRQKWVLVYLKGTFFGGMSVSQRGESLNLFFDKHVNRHTSLKEFLEKYDLILESKCEDEAQEDNRSIHIMPEERMHPSPFELQLANVYTRSIFEKFQAEVLGISSVFASKIEEDEESIIFAVKAYEVQEDSKDKKVKEREYRVVWNAEAGRIYCICRLFEFKGYLCRHALVVFLASSVLEIPSHYILKRWTKDAKTVSVLNVGLNVTDDCSSSITQRFNDICVRCIKLAQEASLSKKGYDVALHALQEALEKVVYENNHPRRIIQNYNPRGSAYYKINEGSQANNIVTPMLYVPNQLGTMLVVCNPQAFQTATTANKRIKYGAEKRASKQKEQKSGDCMQFSHNVATSAEVLHIPSGVNNMSTGCSTKMAVEPMDQLNQEQSVNAANKNQDIRNDMLSNLSHEGPIDIGD